MNPYDGPLHGPGRSSARTIPLTAAELALLDRVADALATSVFESARAEALAELAKTLHIRAGAAGMGHHFPLRESEFRVVEQARDGLRSAPYRQPWTRLEAEVTPALRRMYERLGAARVIHVGGVEMYATDPDQ